MKKVILCLIIALNFSCEETKEVKSEYPKSVNLIIYGNVMETSGIFLGSDNHEYLMIDGHNIDHYIDCKLCKSRDSIKNSK